MDLEQVEQIEYKGYVIQPLPSGEEDGWYFGGYEISKDGRTVAVRRNIFPGFCYFNAALVDSIEHAKLEIESRGGARWMKGESGARRTR